MATAVVSLGVVIRVSPPVVCGVSAGAAAIIRQGVSPYDARRRQDVVALAMAASTCSNVPLSSPNSVKMF